MVNPLLDGEALQMKLMDIVPQMADSLAHHGYFTTTNFMEASMIQRLRDQSISLRNQGRFEQSWSEKIDVNGKAIRFDKEGVFAYVTRNWIVITNQFSISNFLHLSYIASHSSLPPICIFPHPCINNQMRARWTRL